MRLFGFDILVRRSVRAAAPALPPRGGSDQPYIEIQPPFGTNPPSPALGTATASSDLEDRLIWNDPRELWYLALPDKLPPRQVLWILRSALGGDLWQQWQLLSLALDSWPMLRKCSHEIRSAVSNAKYIVRPYAVDEGDEPTESAVEKAQLVSRGLRNMAADPFTDEHEFNGLVYDLSDSILNGLTLSEVMWWDRNGEILPRATAWVHPRHFTFGNNGKLAVFDDAYHRLTFSTAFNPGQTPDSRKFIVSQFASRSGSALGQGLFRPLAWDWSAVVFNREWMLKFAQKYGNPFLEGQYPAGATNNEIQTLNQELANAGNQGWASHRVGTTLTVHPSQPLGENNAQVVLMRQADEHCQILLLGQAGTTTPTPGKLGNDSAHEGVKREWVENFAKWQATVLKQLARSICIVNYGNDDECPEVASDFTEPLDPLTLAQRDQVFITNGVPMLAEEFYDRHNMQMPETGDRVLKTGQMGKLGSTEDEVPSVTPPPELGDGMDAEGDLPNVSASVRKTLARATDKELSTIKALLAKARENGKQNGEWQEAQAVIVKVQKRAGFNRIKL